MASTNTDGTGLGEKVEQMLEYFDRVGATKEEIMTQKLICCNSSAGIIDEAEIGWAFKVSRDVVDGKISKSYIQTQEAEEEYYHQIVDKLFKDQDEYKLAWAIINEYCDYVSEYEFNKIKIGSLSWIHLVSCKEDYSILLKFIKSSDITGFAVIEGKLKIGEAKYGDFADFEEWERREFFGIEAKRNLAVLSQSDWDTVMNYIKFLGDRGFTEGESTLCLDDIDPSETERDSLGGLIIKKATYVNEEEFLKLFNKRDESKYILINYIDLDDTSYYLQFSPDNKYILLNQGDSLVKIDIITGIKTEILPAKVNAISADSRYGISYIEYNTLRVWDIPSKKIIWEMVDEEFEYIGFINFLFSYDNKYLIATCEEGIIHIWNISKRKKIHEVWSNGWSDSVAISRDNRFVLTGDRYPPYEINIANIKNGKIIKKISGHTNSINYVGITSDCKKIVSIGTDPAIKIWDFKTGLILDNIEVFSYKNKYDDDDNIQGVLSPANNYICVPLEFGIKIWNVKDEYYQIQDDIFPDFSWMLGNAFYELAFTQDENMLALTGGNFLLIWKKITEVLKEKDLYVEMNYKTRKYIWHGIQNLFKSPEEKRMIRIMSVEYNDNIYYTEKYDDSGHLFLNLRSKGITDISNIRGLNELSPYLYDLDLSNNQIKEIKGLETLENLRFLYLEKNQITEIKGLESLKNLEELDLSENLITEIMGLDTLTKLKRLNFYYNNISEIKGLEALTNLEDLIFTGNNISEIKGLESLTNLKDLSFTDNRITEIKGLEKLENLRQLVFDDNSISEIKGLETLINLKRLFFYDNQILEIKGLDSLVNLEGLYLPGNLISEIKGLESLTNLKKLRIHNNPIKQEDLEQVGGLDAEGFTNNPQKFVKYSVNLLGKVKQNLFPEEKKMIKTLDLSGSDDRHGWYEKTCQKMLTNGLVYLSKNKKLGNYKTYDKLLGVCQAQDEDAKKLDAAILEGAGGASSLMHQSTISHLTYI